MLAGTSVSPPLERDMAPDLDPARACIDDADLECAWRETSRVLRHRPDDPTAHVLVSGLVWASQVDMASAQADFLPLGLAFATTPARRDLLTLIWQVAAYGSHLDDTPADVDLRGERAALLDSLRRYEGEEPVEEVWKRLLTMFVIRADDEREPSIPSSLLLDLQESRDPNVLFSVAKALPLGSPGQNDILDRLLENDVTNPRYSAWLLYRAAGAPDAAARIRQLAATGLPNPGYADDAYELLASMVPAGSLDGELRAALVRLVSSDERRSDSTEHATRLLARDEEARGNFDAAIEWLDLYERRFGPALHDFGPVRARLLARRGNYAGAAETMLAAIRKGGTDYDRWYEAARFVQKAGQEDEAVRLYQYYLVQLDDRASGALPFGHEATSADVVWGHVRVWSHLIELQPGFFSRAAMRQLLEMLALTAAGLLAAARLSRARAFVLPGALAAEIAFFAGLLTLRANGAIPITAWLWLFSAASRTFVLVAGGLYLSATVGLRRRATSPAWIVASCALAIVAGHVIGTGAGPRYVLDDMPAVARLGELGLAPRALIEIPALLVAILRSDAASALVWPALALGALGARAGFAAKSARRATLGLAVALLAAAVFSAAGSPFRFPAALAGGCALVAVRMRFGAVAPFLLHASFTLGGLIAVAGGLP